MVQRVVLVVCMAACGFHQSANMVPVDAREGMPGADAKVDATPIDASIDTPSMVDGFLLEAEAFSRTTFVAVHRWALATDEAGYAGTGYMQCLPDDGAACTVAVMVTLCGASLVYDVDVAEPGTYFFHARALARDSSQDSIWYGIDGAPAPDPLIVPHDGTWRWTTGDSFDLTAGRHTLHLWHREAGARVDVLALTRSSTPPP